MIKLRLALLALACAACDASSTSAPPTPPRFATTGPIFYTGRLTVTITAPSGVTPVVRVTDPKGTHINLDSTTTLSLLAPGSYTVSADPVTVAGVTYLATIAGSPANVTNGRTSVVSVVYAQAGQLTVTITPPPGATGIVRVTGPEGYTTSLTATTTLTVAHGAYTVTADPVTVADVFYTYSITGSPATVSSGQTASASVVYVPTGTLITTLNNQTSGAFSQPVLVNIAGPATSAGPGGVIGSFTAAKGAIVTDTLTGLTPGLYTPFYFFELTPGRGVCSTSGNPANVIAGQTANLSLTCTVF